MGWEVVYYIIASIIIQAAMAPKPTVPEPATFSDFDFPQVDEGTAQAVVFGEAWSSDWQVLGKGNYSTQPIKSKQGKK